MTEKTQAVGAPLQTPVRRQRGEDVPMLVTAQGAVRVNAATVERDYGDCLLVCVDLHSKRAVLDCTLSGDDEGPSVYLSADEHTMHLDATAPCIAATVLEFYTYKGWRVFCAGGPSRYTLALTLLAPDA